MSPSPTNLTALKLEIWNQKLNQMKLSYLKRSTPNCIEIIVVQPKSIHTKTLHFYLQDKSNISFFDHLSFASYIYLLDMYFFWR